jgi:hypothetical protein
MEAIAELVHCAAAEGAMDKPWLSADTAGLAIGIAGGALVVLCALFGSVSRWLARAGKGHGLVAGGFAALLIAGATAALGGGYGMGNGQPLYIWCPMLGLGAAIIGALAMGLPGIVLRYRRARQRRDLQNLAEQLVRGTSSRLLARAQPPRKWR